LLSIGTAGLQLGEWVKRGLLMPLDEFAKSGILGLSTIAEAQLSGGRRTVLSSLVVAYGFARIRFTCQRFWFTCMLATLMLPFQVQMIPQYIMFRELNWINSFKIKARDIRMGPGFRGPRHCEGLSTI